MDQDENLKVVRGDTINWLADSENRPVGYKDKRGGRYVLYAGQVDSMPAEPDVAVQALVSGDWIYNPVVGQTGIPMIIPSSGTIGNNGALSAITSLPAVYDACYMYFPANAIFAGSVAGMYFVDMSSNTAGVIYNNAYTGGIPTVPSSPTAFATTGPGAYTQATTVTELLSYTVPAGLMGNNGRLEIRGRMSFPNNANTKGMTATFGDASPLTFINNNVTANLGVEFGNSIQNRGTQAIQVANATSFGNLGQTGTAALRGTVNTELAQPLSFKLQIAVATDYVLIERLSVDCFPA